MPDAKHIYKVTYGGWYQRTTLHLSEVYELFALENSKLNLSKERIKELKRGLDIKSVSRESASLEFIRAKTNSGIEIRYYEDGLYVLEVDTDNIVSAEKLLEDYFNNKFSPAIAYIFSLGAPTPKVLANIKTFHPTVISLRTSEPSSFKIDEKAFGETYAKIQSNDITVYKTSKYIFIVAPPTADKSLADLVEMQIFFREFKDQLEKYLNIHRNIWEEISEIKEGKIIKGREVESVRGKLDGYQKTVSLISNRINQMGTYVNTRSSIAKHLKIEEELVSLFEYKYETLSDTLSYIKELWKMTTDYLTSAIQNLVEIKNQSTSNNLKSLQTVTSIGVISGILGYLSGSSLPRITTAGAIYFVILFVVTWLMNYVISKKYQNKQYNLKFGERVRDL